MQQLLAHKDFWLYCPTVVACLNVKLPSGTAENAEDTEIGGKAFLTPQTRPPSALAFSAIPAFAKIGLNLNVFQAGIAENAKSWPFFPLPSSAVALLRLPATVNKVRMVPQHLTTSETQRRATSGVWLGLSSVMHQNVSSVSAFYLWRAIKGTSVFC